MYLLIPHVRVSATDHTASDSADGDRPDTVTRSAGLFAKLRQIYASWLVNIADRSRHL